MRVTIDASSTLLRSAGIKNYIWHWLRHLWRLAGEDEVRAFPYLDDLGRLDHESSVISRWRTLPRLALLYGVNIPRISPLDWVLEGSDIFHATNQVRQAPGKVRLTATVHDLTWRLMPQMHTPANVRADRGFAEHILPRAAGLIAVSEHTRQDAIRLLRIAPEKIEVIYSGVAEEYFHAAPAQRERPYVLFVGTIEPRKNLDTLVDAWQQTSPALRQEYELVIAGPQGWASENTLARIRAVARYLGYVPEADLPGLVAGAAVFVYPSLYEGFGFPVVQAMAAGVPVVTSNVSALPEVTGGAALLVDPRSPGEICAAISSLLLSESRRADMAARSRVRAQRYQWETCARQSLEFFRRLI